jgi:Ca2+/H+ antiporter
MIEEWSALSLLIFISIIIIVVYTVGLWAGTVLKDQIEKDKIREAQRLADEKKNTRPVRRR